MVLHSTIKTPELFTFGLCCRRAFPGLTLASTAACVLFYLLTGWFSKCCGGRRQPRSPGPAVNTPLLSAQVPLAPEGAQTAAYYPSGQYADTEPHLLASTEEQVEAIAGRLLL